MEIKELKEYTSEAGAQLRLLMQQLSSTRPAPAEAQLRAVLASPSSHLYCLYADDGSIVGCATLCLFISPTGQKGSVEDVVVDARYRGQGLGRALMEYVIQEARRYSPIELHLTSKPARVAANALYQSLGFEKRETNFYRMIL